MKVFNNFRSEDELELSEEFQKVGYVIRPVSDREVLDSVRQEVVSILCEYLKVDAPKDPEQFLNDIHDQVSVPKLNDMRLHVYNQINLRPWLRPSYYRLASHVIDCLVGNELAMQGRINLSIQYPQDTSSVLGLHADSWSGESPFQVVVWLPLVSVYDTKSMYLLDRENNTKAYEEFGSVCSAEGSTALFEAFKDELKWIEIPYGNVMIFDPSLIHGNVMNETKETRWSFNTRFKALLTPYTSPEKGLGNFYVPATTRVMTTIGMDYNPPKV